MTQPARFLESLRSAVQPRWFTVASLHERLTAVQLKPARLWFVLNGDVALKILELEVVQFTKVLDSAGNLADLNLLLAYSSVDSAEKKIITAKVRQFTPERATSTAEMLTADLAGIEYLDYACGFSRIFATKEDAMQHATFACELLAVREEARVAAHIQGLEQLRELFRKRFKPPE